VSALRAAGLVIAGLCPGPLARAIYRACFGYRIDRRARIGFAYVDCQSLTIGPGVVIDHGVVFTRCGEVQIGECVEIGPLNVFRGGTRIRLDPYVTVLRLNVFNAIPDHECTGNPDSSLSIGRGAVVTQGHRLDFTDRITLGRSVILAGRGTSLWTHNRQQSAPIEIGEYCYVGSEARVAAGASVPPCSIVGMGAVIVRGFDTGYALFAGVPAVRKRELTPDDYATIFHRTRNDLPDDGYRPALPEGSTSPIRFEDVY
jgi:carbonic anhydrase/acetyltransferase-like protein (isoleucine patch superfamily)